jgi:hypothetical protein
MKTNDAYRNVFLITLGGFLLGWFIKMPIFLWTYINKTSRDFPVTMDFFPAIFESPLACQIFYFLPILSIALFFRKEQWLMKATGILLCCCSAFLILHISTYNDATFVTSFWVALWMTWFACNLHQDDSKLRFHACSLAMCLVSVIFFGGFIGKCTPEWWSGEVMFGIMDKFLNHWPFGWIKNNTTFEELKDVSKYMSWSIILIELALASSFLWPKKLTLRYVPFLILGIVFFRTWRILSVISCLVFMMWACLLILPAKQKLDEEEAQKEEEGNITD